MNLQFSRPHRIVLTYGRFDGLSQAHLNFLRQLNLLGSDVIVGCTSDDLAARVGMPCRQDFEARRAALESCRYVSRVICQHQTDQARTDIVNYNACTLAMGQEWRGFFDHLQDIAQVSYLTRTEVAQHKKIAVV